MMNNLFEVLKKYRPILENRIISTLNDKRSEESSIPFFEDAINRLSTFATTGKLIRGSLLLLTANSFGIEPEKISDIAAAVELSHSGLLIHDDIIDNDRVRRGNKTIFAQYETEAEAKKIKDQTFYGHSMAICVADIAYFMSYELIATNASIDDGKKLEVAKIFTREIQKVGAAEMADTHFGVANDEPTIDDVLTIYKYKSARYTFSLPFILGATIGGASGETISRLDAFGEKLGIVFQIKDDEIGLFGDEEKIGKPIGGDIKQNKKTIFRALLYQKVTPEQKQIADNIFGKTEIYLPEIEIVKDLITKMGIKDDIEKMVEDNARDARNILATIDISEEFKTILSELVEYNLHRSV
ncbi:MAG TPA: polyprenyl synthetase family protein [Patescibacteria group bacterium]|nr:polyprenyl synthetase family protein [Patescibacteria group bacterium]